MPRATMWQIDERVLADASQSAILQTQGGGVRRPAGRRGTLRRYFRQDVAKWIDVEPEPLELTEDGIAIVYVEGVLTTREADSWDLFGSNYEQLAGVFERLLAGPVMPVVIRFDTPGGHAIGIERVAQLVAMLADTRLVVAHVANCCCSAGYRLASQCGTIVSLPDADVGSIGTMCQLFDYSKWFEVEGVRSVLLKTGAFKGLGALGEPVTEEQTAFLQSDVDQMNAGFLEDVKRGRGFSDEQLAAVSDGRWYSAAAGRDLGLVDWIGSFEEVLAGIRSARGGDMTKATLAAGGNASAAQANETSGGATQGTNDSAGTAAAGSAVTETAAGGEPAATSAAPSRGLAEYMAAFGDGPGAVMFRDGLSWEAAQAKTIESLRGDLNAARSELDKSAALAKSLGNAAAGGTDAVALGREEKAASLADAFRRSAKN